MIDINNLTYGQIKELRGLFQQDSGPKSNGPDTYMVLGENYMLRTITFIYVGKLVSVTEKEILITDASWIAETGRWHEFIKSGSIKECEPYPDGQEVIINRDSLVDATIWRSPLPRQPK